MRLALITIGSIQTVTQQYNFGRSNGMNFVFQSPEKQKRIPTFSFSGPKRQYHGVLR